MERYCILCSRFHAGHRGARFGDMLFGRAQEELIHFSEETCWSGGIKRTYFSFAFRHRKGFPLMVLPVPEK